MRHTSFRFTVEDPSAELAGVLARHAGAARYAFNACLGLVKQAVAAHRDDPGAPVPYSGFDLINAWNHVKTSPAAGPWPNCPLHRWPPWRPGRWRRRP